ncbi:MAG: hydantoinase/oxoprolinase family protein [Alphaproteobacteria bacterium]|nr:hydantoinase/oxoprolinase family protein [Alphaproteobacteria bacterium]
MAVDIGGTFTDVVLEADGRRWTRKVLTTPAAPERGVMDGVAATVADAGFALADVDMLIHGTTLATNAIIERKGALTALVATEGFRDTIDIAYESRYDQYDVFIDKPAALVPRWRRLTVPERVDVKGAVRLPLDMAAVDAVADRLAGMGVESVAVALMHSYANTDHERRIRDVLARRLPGVGVTLSCEVCPEIREYERTSTAIANAYVQPLMAGYLARLEAALAAGGFAGAVYLMTSGGGLTTIATARRFPIRLVESGPAGGAILASHIAAAAGEEKVLSYDMGGTTAKICLIEKYRPSAARSFEVDRAARFLKGSGLPLRIPVIEMVEIGAGGGSIARVDSLKRITVGPDSAGSEPGPACYGRGGTLPTVTDADVVLGKIDPARFAGGKIALYPDRAAAALEATVGGPLGLGAEMAALGVAEIVDENMANAARVHAVERGEAADGHTIVAFGGAAPLHAARLAEKLGIDRVIVPVNAGVGSAVGFLLAPIAYEVVHSRYMRLDGFDADAANALLREMSREARDVVAAGARGRTLTERRYAFMRYVGQGHEIVVPLPDRALTAADRDALQAAYDAEYRTLFARIVPTAAVEVLSWGVVVSTEAPLPAPVADPGARLPAAPAGRVAVFDAETGERAEIPLYVRGDLPPGSALAGPAVIAEDETSTYVPARFDARIAATGSIVLERRA